MSQALLLARFQFAFTIGFHIMFPAMTMGLAVFLAIIEGLWLRSGKVLYFQIYQFWVKIFAVTFGMGVVSGIVLSYQFGTNFSRFSRAVGNIIGPLHGYEVLTAFFLEASFLGIMLFGWRRVDRKMHFAATCIVAVGTLLSAFWILSANSWMHTPAGYELVDGVFMVRNWLAVIFNPSFPYRFVHMMLGSYLTTALLISGISAYHLLRDQAKDHARASFAVASLAIAVLAPLQILAGDQHGLEVERNQPVKLAAMEALWETQRAAPFTVLAWPDQAAQRNRWAIEIPYVGSLLLKHDPQGELKGLDQVAPADQPNVPLIFFAFRLMVALGFLFLFLGGLALWLRWRTDPAAHPWLLRLYVLCTPLGLVAIEAGWITTESGRQPWIVQGLMRTTEAVSPVPAQALFTSLSLFIAVYGLLFSAYVYYVLKLVFKGPDPEVVPHDVKPARTAWVRD